MNERPDFDRNSVDVNTLLEPGSKAREMFDYLSSSPRVQSYFRAANRMAVSRLGYTDHGPIHAKVATWNALTAFDILDRTFKANVEAEGIGDKDDARMVVLAATYLHDVGMVIHRQEHSQSAVLLAQPVLEEKIYNMYPDPGKATDIMSAILHGIYAHDDDTACLTFESGCVKLGDGCDLTKGRTVVPFMQGKVDIHSISAMAIKDVFLEHGDEKPLSITVAMDNPAGVFQVEAVLVKKLSTTGLMDHIKVGVLINGERLLLSQVLRLHRNGIPEEEADPDSTMSNK
ncbi:MAG: phosphohydrolase [Candidatus Thorarchaeota archaeon]|jgi:metal-dependent HD superfamily phosphatase/phosphodiesterase